MPRFLCTTLSPSGLRNRVRTDAASRESLIRELDNQGVLLLEVDEIGDAGSAAIFGMRHSVQLLEVVRALGSLLRAGLNVPEAMTEATSFVDGRALEMLESLSSRVEQGERLADAMARHPEWFDAFMIGVVRAAERSGDLGAALERLEEKLERDADIRSELLGALIYPALLTVAGGAAVCVLLGVVLPRFAEILTAAGGALPASTRLVLALSEVVSSWWWVVGAGVVGAGIAVQTVVRPSARAYTKSLALLRLPGVSVARRELLTARYARMLSVLLGGGTPLSEGLRYCEMALDDPLVRRDAALVRSKVEEGSSFRQALAAASVFAPTFQRLVAAGEATGRLDHFLVQAADFYERRMERATRRIVALVEPGLIIVFGLIVGFIALAVVQSIYSINAQAW